MIESVKRRTCGGNITMPYKKRCPEVKWIFLCLVTKVKRDRMRRQQQAALWDQLTCADSGIPTRWPFDSS